MRYVGYKMNYSWMNDGNLSGKSDRDYLGELVQSLTQDLHADPNSVELLFKRGNAYLDLGLYEEAVIDYTGILQVEEIDSRVWNNRGICYRIIGETGQAISDLDKAISLDKQYRDAYNNLGMVLSDLGNYEEAINNFSKSIEIDDTYVYAYNNRAMSYWALGKKEEAFSDYETVKNLFS